MSKTKAATLPAGESVVSVEPAAVVTTPPAPKRTSGRVPGETPTRTDRLLTIEEAWRLRTVAQQKRIAAGQLAGHDQLGAKFMAMDALDMDQHADVALNLPDGAVQIGRGGEALPMETVSLEGFRLHNTLTDSPSATAARASMRRLELLEKTDTLALAVDMGETVQPADSMERMLAHQMATLHALMMRTAAKATAWLEGTDPYREGDGATASVEATRLLNATARMASAFNDGAATLQRIRSGGTQRVVVQHVNVTEGGQAVVAGGDIEPGGWPRRGSKAK